MTSRINLNHHGQDLSKALKEICDSASTNNWVIFGYEGATPSLQVDSIGDGGLEAASEELNSGRIQYLYCRVKDPNTQLDKFVLVHWQGESVPELRKGTFATHFDDVKKFVGVTHVTIQARSENDIDAADILKKVAASSGSNYSFHKEAARPMPAMKPVGSVYERTNAANDISSTRKDEFWTKQREEDRQRLQREAEQKRHEQTKLDDERRQREKTEQQARDAVAAQRQRAAADKATKELAAAKSPGLADMHDVHEALADAQQRGARSDQMRRDRQQEIARLMDERKKVQPDAAPEKPRSDSQTESNVRRQELSEMISQRKNSSAGDAKEVFEPRRKSQFDRAEPSGAQAASAAAPAAAASSVAACWAASPSVAPPAAAASHPNMYASDQPHEVSNEDAALYENLPDGTQPVVAHGDDEGAEQPANGDLRAVALYDYDATEADELNLRAGDVISGIRQVDEGWWMGFGPDGAEGLFPANYVQVQ